MSAAVSPAPSQLEVFVCVLVIDEHGNVLLTRIAAAVPGVPSRWWLPGCPAFDGESFDDTLRWFLPDHLGLMDPVLVGQQLTYCAPWPPEEPLSSLIVLFDAGHIGATDLDRQPLRVGQYVRDAL